MNKKKHFGIEQKWVGCYWKGMTSLNIYCNFVYVFWWWVSWGFFYFTLSDVPVRKKQILSSPECRSTEKKLLAEASSETKTLGKYRSPSPIVLSGFSSRPPMPPSYIVMWRLAGETTEYSRGDKINTTEVLFIKKVHLVISLLRGVQQHNR